MANKPLTLSLSEQALNLLAEIRTRDAKNDGISQIGASVVVTRALELYAQAHVQKKEPAQEPVCPPPWAEKYVLKEDLRPLYDEAGAAAARLLPLLKRLDALEKTVNGTPRLPPLAKLMGEPT